MFHCMVYHYQGIPMFRKIANFLLLAFHRSDGPFIACLRLLYAYELNITIFQALTKGGVVTMLARSSLSLEQQLDEK